MSGEDKPRRRRRLSDDEHALWRGVTRSVAPLRRASQALFAAALEMGGLERKAKPVAKRSNPVPSRQIGVPQAVPAAKPQRAERALAPPVFDRRHKRRLVRGAEPIGARIDLHGCTQSEAHAALLAFLAGSQANGSKIVLVITGKGGPPDGVAGERGVLRKQVPQWLAQAAFRAYVAGVEEAHFAHGGAGALYVRLRRA
jgi:DNA-nicking Smr family endonuclease